MNNSLLVAKAMPVHSALALANMVHRNPHYNGAAWEDCLDILMDCDANLEVTESMYEALADEVGHPQLITPVTLTLFYARTGRFHAPVDPDLVEEYVGLNRQGTRGLGAPVMSLVKITLWCETSDTTTNPEWRNGMRFLDRCRKGIDGVAVVRSQISEYEPEELS